MKKVFFIEVQKKEKGRKPAVVQLVLTHDCQLNSNENRPNSKRKCSRKLHGESVTAFKSTIDSQWKTEVEIKLNIVQSRANTKRVRTKREIAKKSLVSGP